MHKKILSGLVYFTAILLLICPACKSRETVHAGLDPETDLPGVLPIEACGVWCWYSTGGAPNKWDGKISPDETYPNLKGIPIVIGWNELEPEDGVFNWDLIDDIIKKAAANNKYVFTLLWLNPVNAEWLYEKGVPKVEINTFKTDPHFATLPYPFDEKYKFYSERIITKLANHLRNLPPELFERVLFHQVVEGSTGDGFCYKGDPIDPKYAISREDWAVYQEYIRKFTIDAFAGEMNGKPEIPLLMHTTDILWGAEQYSGFVTKKGVASHFYHHNGTQSKQNIYGPFNTSDNSLGRPVYARGEGETMWMRDWFKKDSLQNLYWSAIYAIHCGLDIWNIPDHVLSEKKWYMALDFFDKYAGQKFPEKSPVAFCAMKDELNCDDTLRFPTEKYGQDPMKNLDRAFAILKEFEDHGAVIQDPEKCLSNTHTSRSRSGYNDVGVDRIYDDYNLYLYPIDKVETSVGWWHVGPKDQPYGRFARGFEHASGKDTLFFRFHRDFFKEKENEKKELQIRIVWLDNNEGSWEFSYDAGEGEFKTGQTFTGEGSKRWREDVFTVNDAIVNGNGPRGSSIALINADDKDQIFHIIEVERTIKQTY